MPEVCGIIFVWRPLAELSLYLHRFQLRLYSILKTIIGETELSGTLANSDSLYNTSGFAGSS